jgi:hypothetical protein
MKFNQEVSLVGVVGKKGNGTLDNGQTWSTDRVELHVLTPFPDSETMAFGNTITSYSVDNFQENFERAKMMVGKTINLEIEMTPAKKLGQAPRFTCIGFRINEKHRVEQKHTAQV